MNTPPRFFAAPPPSSRRKLSLALGAGLLLGLIGVTTLIYVQAWPAWLFKAAVAVAALAWAGHVLAVTLHNRALDRSSHLSSRPERSGEPGPRTTRESDVSGSRVRSAARDDSHGKD